jgi:hypothetical protein
MDARNLARAARIRVLCKKPETLGASHAYTVGALEG